MYEAGSVPANTLLVRIKLYSRSSPVRDAKAVHVGSYIGRRTVVGRLILYMHVGEVVLVD